jgi:D-alanine transaminase
MSIVYVNGRYVPATQAAVSIFDRGFQLGDAIYEVWAVRDGALLDTPGHLARLARSLRELGIAPPMNERALMAVVHETMRRNRVRSGVAYLQISRGAPRARDHVFPTPPVAPTLVVTAKNLDQTALQRRFEQGVAVISTPETRWARRDIKSVNLLPNVLARQAAKEAGAFEAWFVDDAGLVTEGTASNAWIVDREGRLRTRALSNLILHGVTRATLLRLAAERQMTVLEEPFTIDDVRSAREAFISSATNPAVAVVSIDGVTIGDGRPGPVAKLLLDAYFEASEQLQTSV